MHYTGTIWRPPYEAKSLLLEVTAGCTHHKCKFCTLYNDLTFDFKMSPIKDIESDLLELQTALFDPISKITSIMTGNKPFTADRVFLTGANPFTLSYDKLSEISALIRKYLPFIKTIGSFARITDISSKTDDELSRLFDMGYDALTIGIETGDNKALEFMNKGYVSSDIIKQCSRLDKAGIHYNFFYLAGISGAGCGKAGAKLTANVCNQLNPVLIGINMLTIYPDSELFTEIKNGNWYEESELEKYTEIRTLIEHLKIKTCVAAMGSSNAFHFQGDIPRDKIKLLGFLDKIIDNVSEGELMTYRKSVKHL